VLKILRDGPVHTIREIEVSALLTGDFETSYTAGDNTKVVPTDTIKNRDRNQRACGNSGSSEKKEGRKFTKRGERTEPLNS
jgi:urate oxidase